MENSIHNLLAAAKAAADNPPTREKVIEAIEDISRTYAGFKCAGYEPGQTTGNHYVWAEFEGRENPVTVCDPDVCFAICLLNARLMREFLKPREEAA